MGKGKTLVEQLDEYELGDFREEIKTYVGEVETFRRHHAHIKAPERLPLFRGGQLPLSKRFGAASGIRHLGGDWQNLFGYARGWAFLYPDWLSDMRISPNADVHFGIETLALTLNGIRLPVYWDAPVWQIQIEHVREIRIGALVQNDEPDFLRLALLALSSPKGDRPWQTRPQVFTLNPKIGEAQPASIPLANRRLPQVIKHLAKAEKQENHAPLNALRKPSLCQTCGYIQLCYQRKMLSSRLFTS
jgi:hypothetical protein